MNVLVADSDSKALNKTVRILKGMGCEVFVAESRERVLHAAVRADHLNVVLLATHDAPDEWLEICGDLRRRHLSERHPQLVLHGKVNTPRQLLSAFQLGVSDWVGRIDRPLLSWHTAIGRQLSGPRRLRHDALSTLRQLNLALEGVFKCTAGDLDARIEVRAGRICRVALTPNSRPLMRVVELEARRNLAQANAWYQRLPGGTPHVRKALVDFGMWDRVRLRDALAAHARHALRVLASAERLAVSFEPGNVHWATDLSFAPEELFDSEDGKSGVFLRASLDFLSRQPDNDVRMTSVS
jgi:CheY-like chemotaxis protein